MLPDNVNPVQAHELLALARALYDRPALTEVPTAERAELVSTILVETHHIATRWRLPPGYPRTLVGHPAVLDRLLARVRDEQASSGPGPSRTRRMRREVRRALDLRATKRFL